MRDREIVHQRLPDRQQDRAHLRAASGQDLRLLPAQQLRDTDVPRRAILWHRFLPEPVREGRRPG